MLRFRAKSSHTETRTNPKLWERAKRAAGKKFKEDSARKMQWAVHYYKKHGGGYFGKRSDKNSLHRWTEEHWRTMNGKPAKRGGVTHRYLPDAKWNSLTPSQREATDRKKVMGSKKGKKIVPNTKAARVRHMFTELKF